jgi:hypothetical protein
MNWFVQVIQDCLKEKPEALAELWRTVDIGVRPGLRAILSFLVREDVDGRLHEFYSWLIGQHLQPLLNFHGDSEAELHAYLWTIARHWLFHRLHQEQNARRREAEAIREHDRGDHAGASQAAILAALERLRPLLNEKQRRKLAFILGESKPDKPPSERTVRRWRTEMYKKCTEVLREAVDEADREKNGKTEDDYWPLEGLF